MVKWKWIWTPLDEEWTECQWISQGLQVEWYGPGTHVASPQQKDVLLSTFASPGLVEGRCSLVQALTDTERCQWRYLLLSISRSASCAFPAVGATTLTTQRDVSRKCH